MRRRAAWLAGLAAVVGVLSAVAILGVRGSGDPSATALPAPSTAAPKVRGPVNPPKPRRGASVTRTTPVPILMYHLIAVPPDDAAYPDLYVRPVRFREHVTYLARRRYEVVTLQQVWDHWHGGKSLPRKPVAITFDDGSRDWYTHAYPILREHGWVGTMHLTVNDLNRWGTPARFVRKLVEAGWELDSHSLTHPDLTLLGGRELHREVAGSRRKLRRLFGVPVNFFCYPVGRYDEVVIAAVRKAGYLGATTIVDGLAVPRPPYALRRVRINGSDDAGDLARKLSAA